MFVILQKVQKNLILFCTVMLAVTKLLIDMVCYTDQFLGQRLRQVARRITPSPSRGSVPFPPFCGNQSDFSK